MTNVYPIEGTTNKHPEQLCGAYLDPDFWPGFQDTVELFKKTLVDCAAEKKPYSVLRISHSEMSAFYIVCNIKKRVGNFHGRQSSTGTISQKAMHDMFESVIAASSVSTQIGYDFEKWIREVRSFTDGYRQWRLSRLIQLPKPNFALHPEVPERNLRELIDFPMDIIYGLIANKWLFRTFKNRIGLIGADAQLSVIKRLMEYQEYQEYLGTDYFTDYIEIPQRGALDDEDLADKVGRGVVSSSCDLFLIGAGVSKMRFFRILNKIKNCVYLDVGHGILLLAGYGDNMRPYCGEWINYRLPVPPPPEKIDCQWEIYRQKEAVVVLPSSSGVNANGAAL